jgi:hypothetical protein
MSCANYLVSIQFISLRALGIANHLLTDVQPQVVVALAFEIRTAVSGSCDSQYDSADQCRQPVPECVPRSNGEAL